MAKKGTNPLQRWTTIKGQTATETLQPMDEWLDLADFEDAVVSMDVAELNAATSSAVDVIVESAGCVDTATTNWQEVAKLSAMGTSLVYSSTRPSATTHFIRYLRWRINAGNSGDWSATFKVCATVK
jgi:hypothetical protein